ncbi:hypothetical protein O9992_17075 [Vibrio lentus]|nr:hypothetical protein [Vibrio lentus]
MDNCSQTIGREFLLTHWPGRVVTSSSLNTSQLKTFVPRLKQSVPECKSCHGPKRGCCFVFHPDKGEAQVTELINNLAIEPPERLEISSAPQVVKRSYRSVSDVMKKRFF